VYRIEKKVSIDIFNLIIFPEKIIIKMYDRNRKIRIKDKI